MIYSRDVKETTPFNNNKAQMFQDQNNNTIYSYPALLIFAKWALQKGDQEAVQLISIIS